MESAEDEVEDIDKLFDCDHLCMDRAEKLREQPQHCQGLHLASVAIINLTKKIFVDILH